MAGSGTPTISAAFGGGPAAGTAGSHQHKNAQYFENDVNNPFRRVTFRLGLAMVFLRFSLFNFVLMVVTHANFRLLYLLGLPTLLGVMLNGGLRRSFQGRPARYWSGYLAWMAVAVVFSSWRGGSAHVLLTYLRAEFPLMLIIAGLGMTWSEFRSLLNTIACAAAMSVLTMPLFERQMEARTTLQDFGTVSDPNDYSAHLLLVLPFLLWVGFNGKSSAARAAAFAGVAFGLVVILKTGSRGGAVALATAILFFLFQAPARQRLVLMLLAPLAAASLVAVVPHATLGRLTAVNEANLQNDTEMAAYGSIQARKYLFQKSVEYTLDHPVFGVGPEQFAMYEGTHNRITGTHGSWHSTHNTYTEVSSECGIPALVFFLAGIISSFRLMNSVHREARRRPDCDDIRSAALCSMLALVGFCAAIVFLDFAYQFYLPAMGGLSIFLFGAARDEMQKRLARAQAGAAPSGDAPAFRPPRVSGRQMARDPVTTHTPFLSN